MNNCSKYIGIEKIMNVLIYLSIFVSSQAMTSFINQS